MAPSIPPKLSEHFDIPSELNPQISSLKKQEDCRRNTSSLDLPLSTYTSSVASFFSSSQNLFSLDENGDTSPHVIDLPPTTNELDPVEKARLLRKARKLSQVLGEIPTFEALKPPNASTTSISSTQGPASDGHNVQVAAHDRRISQRLYQPLLPNALQTFFFAPLPTSTALRPSTAPDPSAHNLATKRRPVLSIHVPSLSVEKTNSSMLSPNQYPMSVPTSPVQKRLSTIAGTPPLESEAAVTDGYAESAVKPPLNRSSSMDINPPGSTIPPHTSLPFPSLRLKRSQSLWSHRGLRRSKDPILHQDFQRRYFRNFWEEYANADDEKHVLNVRRARKVAQIFGQEPPSELIVNSDLNRPRAQSLAHRTGSNHIPSSPVSSSQSHLSSERAEGVDITEHASTEVIVNLNEDDHCSDDFSDQLLHRSTTPTKLNAIDQHSKREAKLSRFFGVDYQDLRTCLEGVTPAVSRLDQDEDQMTPKDVDIKIGRRSRRFWNFGEGEGQMKDADISEVIEHLRGLKA
ncbi:hypothetical protein AX16_005576 [Volvariella volvacea WC 439]|nr:hypothetical protein AX16_005576 [Volvariella volvacea WC 439]